jgi:hypothetical protein
MKKSSSYFIKTLFLLNILFANEIHAQSNSTIISGQDRNRRVITTAVPFLNFAPDSRHSGMGDVGVATSPDANAAHWNIGKLAFIGEDLGFSLSYSPWLGRITNDMSLSYLTGFKKIDENSYFGFDLRYFNMGSIQLTDIRGAELGEFNPRDLALGGSYSRKLSANLGIGVSARFIHSNLSGNISSAGGNEGRPGVSVGTDVGLYYNKDIGKEGKVREWSWGVMISNVGSKLTYNSSQELDFIPSNLRIGSAYAIHFDEKNKITFALDLNKLLVPTTPVYKTNEFGNLVTDQNGKLVIARGKDPNRGLISGILGSMNDAPDGFKEEIQEITISTGAEFTHNNQFALRTGYFYENPNKGGRRYFTMGLGFKYYKIGFDFSYLVPQVQNHPLAETLRVSLAYNITTK